MISDCLTRHGQLPPGSLRLPVTRRVTPTTEFWIELLCGSFAGPRRRWGKTHPTPAKYAEAWRAVAKAAEALLDAIAHIDQIGAARLEVMGLFQSGAETAEAVRDKLPHLVPLALAVAEIEAARRRVPSKSDSERDRLAAELIAFWTSHGGSTGATGDGRPRGFSRRRFPKRWKRPASSGRSLKPFARCFESMVVY